MKTLATMAVVALLLGGCASCGKQDEPAKQDTAQDDEDFDTPINRAEKVEFHVEPDADPYYGRVPFTVQFSAVATNFTGKVTYEWTFGDGEKSTEQNPKHTFAKPGLYTTNVRGTDEAGHGDGGALIVRALTLEQAEAMQAEFDRKGIDSKVL